MSESHTKGTYPGVFFFTLLEFDAPIQFFQEFRRFLIITNLEELYPDLRWVKGVSRSLSGVGDSRWIKYLVIREIIILKEIGCLDDPFFWAIGWFAKGGKVFNIHMRSKWTTGRLTGGAVSYYDEIPLLRSQTTCTSGYLFPVREQERFEHVSRRGMALRL